MPRSILLIHKKNDSRLYSRMLRSIVVPFPLELPYLLDRTVNRHAVVQGQSVSPSPYEEWSQRLGRLAPLAPELIQASQ